jgi:hypothetical protein
MTPDTSSKGERAEQYPKRGLVFPCGRAKRLVCWIWHRNGHWTVEEIAVAHQRAQELRAKFGVSQ